MIFLFINECMNLMNVFIIGRSPLYVYTKKTYDLY